MPVEQPLTISSTIIVISKDKKALILQRPSNKSFGNMWTVAGGKLDKKDGVTISEDFRYHPAEFCARRELEEETGIKLWVDKIKYLCTIIAKNINRMIMSYYVVLDKDAKDVEVNITEETQNYVWITEKQVDKYNFIPDIGGEIKDVFRRLKNENL